MFYLKDIKSGRIVTVRKVRPSNDGEKVGCWTDSNYVQLEDTTITTKGIPIVLCSEDEVNNYIEIYKEDFPEWNIKAFKLVEVEWE